MTRVDAIEQARGMGLAVRTRYDGELELFDEMTLRAHATSRTYEGLFEPRREGVSA